MSYRRRSVPRPLYKTLIEALVLATLVAMAAVALDWLGATAPETGAFAAVDGDSLRRDGADIRLFGIDAPELHQTCGNRMGGDYPCGREAKVALAELVRGRDLLCRVQDIDRYGRTVARCTAGDLDIAGAMVRQGWAVAYFRHSADYAVAEAEARKAKRGIWQGLFQDPEAWREDHREALGRGAMGGAD